VSNVEDLVLANGTNTITLAAEAEEAGIVNVTGDAGDDEIDASAYTVGINIDAGEGDNSVTGGAGDDTLAAGAGDDTLVAGTGDDNITMGDGSNEVQFNINELTTDDTVAGGVDTDQITLVSAGELVDADLTNVSSVEKLVLANGENDITLGDLAAVAGLSTVVGGSSHDTLNLTDDNQVTGDITGINFESASGSDTFNIGGLTVTGTLALNGGSDVIVATDGADIRSLNAGAETTAEELWLTGGITMTLAQHEAMTIVASGGFETGADIDTVTLTTSGVFTGQSDVETYNLADAAGNVFSQNWGNSSVNGGSGDDRIFTSSNDGERGELTVNLSEGGNDTVVINNGGYLSIYQGDWNDGYYRNVFVGDVLNGFHSDSSSDDPDSFDWNTPVSTGNYADAINNWTSGGTYAVTILGFTAGDGADYDVIETNWYGFADMSDASFVNNAVLNQTDLSGVGTGSVIELDADQSFQLVNFANLDAVAALLSNSGDGDALLSLNDGNYTVVLYSGSGAVGSGNPASAYIYHITVDEGDGLDFVSNEAFGNYDADSIELVGVLVGVGANALDSNNFA